MTSTLLVEGTDDQEVVRHLLWHYGFEMARTEPGKPLRHSKFGDLRVERPQLLEQDAPGAGFDRLLDRLDSQWKSSTAYNLGIIVDRDLDLPSKPNPWPSLRKRILKTIPELKLPDEADALPKEGLVVDHDSGRRLGVWIMPDNENLGMLETFASSMVRPDDRLWPRAKAAVDAIPHEERAFKHKVDKAYIHTWLAWQEEPGSPMGTAIRARYLDAQSPTAQNFVHWVQALLAK